MTTLLRLLLVAPWWRGCQASTEKESRELAAGYLEDMPDLVARRERAAAALGLDLPDQADVLVRLREVTVGVGENFVLIFTPEGHPYEPLIRN
ncbi:hypothetical protein [Streptomyces sp. NPDC017991]|uniref:hypothetical protein n=1 Tax=Streptomyces sp. NPDC017991 TaxID=3365026 RepID=UPI0037A19E5C